MIEQQQLKGLTPSRAPSPATSGIGSGRQQQDWRARLVRWWQERRSGEARIRLETAWALYRQIVARARRPFLYRDLQVPDTPEGRFEMVQLHVGLLTLRLDEEGEAGSRLAQTLFDCMMKDMDRSLRELAIGDLSVGKYVKRMAQSFFFRLQHLDRALATGDRAPLLEVLEKNVYEGRPDRAAVRDALADELIAEAICLRGLGRGDVMAGRLPLPPDRAA